MGHGQSGAGSQDNGGECVLGVGQELGIYKMLALPDKGLIIKLSLFGTLFSPFPGFLNNMHAMTE